jgi:hypothetical protein
MLGAHAAKNSRRRSRNMEITGGCLCKAVRYSVSAAPIVTRSCWCRVCQYIGAGSGNVMHRRFCPICGTHLFTASEARPRLTFVRAGTLDDREIARPAATIWTTSAPSWACFDERIPKVERQPPPPPLS